MFIKTQYAGYINAAHTSQIYLYQAIGEDKYQIRCFLGGNGYRLSDWIEGKKKAEKALTKYMRKLTK